MTHYYLVSLNILYQLADGFYFKNHLVLEPSAPSIATLRLSSGYSQERGLHGPPLPPPFHHLHLSSPPPPPPPPPLETIFSLTGRNVPLCQPLSCVTFATPTSTVNLTNCLLLPIRIPIPLSVNGAIARATNSVLFPAHNYKFNFRIYTNRKHSHPRARLGNSNVLSN